MLNKVNVSEHVEQC